LRRASISLAKSRPGQVTYASSGDGSPEHIAGELLKSMAEINKILKLPDVRERFATLGADPAGETAEQFGSYIKSEVAKFAKVARERHLELE
jgi:tripartite-type tricarboxylate transporter receptor subunit TctC